MNDLPDHIKGVYKKAKGFAKLIGVKKRQRSDMSNIASAWFQGFKAGYAEAAAEKETTHQGKLP